MDFLELSKTRFTAKKYDASAKIPEEQIEKLKEILRLTPSAINIQPWFFLWGSSDEAKALVRPALFPLNYDRLDTCSHFVVIAVRDDISEQFQRRVNEKETQDGRYNSADEASARLESNLNYVRQQAQPDWQSRQGYIALASLLYAAASMGIDSTPIEGFDTDRMDSILNLYDIGACSIVMVTLGYDAKDDHNRMRPKSRLNGDEIMINLDARAAGK